jgi:MFS family permease
MTRAALAIFAVLAVVYVISHFFRVSNAVIAPDLMRDLALSSEAMGTLTGSFFVAFAAAQIPIGMMLDRFGTRITVPAMLAFAVLGSLVFAAATGMLGLTAGRVLMGIGCAGIYIGALVVCMRWFPPRHFATVAGTLVALGNLGNLLATQPLAEVVAVAGWRSTFVGMAAIAAAGALLEFALVRDAPPGHAFHDRARDSLADIAKGVGEVLRHPELPPMLTLQFVAYANTMTILGLWGGPYLYDVHGLGLEARGSVLLWMSAGIILGNLCFGPLDRVFDTRKGVVYAGSAATVAALVALAAIPTPPVWLVAILFSAVAFLNAYNVVALAHARTIFPDHLVGRGMTILALATMGGVAVMQIATGFLIGAFADEAGRVGETGYRVMYAFIAATVVVGILHYSRTTDVKPSSERGRSS